MADDVKWLQNHRETQVFSTPAGDGFLVKLSQFSWLKQLSPHAGEFIEVQYFHRGEVPDTRGFARALDLGPSHGTPPQDPPTEPGFSHQPVTGPWFQNHRVTPLHVSSTGADALGTLPQFSTHAQILKQSGDRMLVYYFGNGTIPAGEGWILATDLGPVGTPAQVPPNEPPGPTPPKTLRPPLDFSDPPSVFNSKPRSFQVIAEGNRFWHANQAEADENFFCDCGPIAVAHAVNFTHWSQGNNDTINAHDGIVALSNAGIYGGAPRDRQTTVPARLGEMVTQFTGIDTIKRSGMDFDTALELGRTRWIMIDHFGALGHISVAVTALDGSARLAMVQHNVNSGGILDAGDLMISESEWGNWNELTFHPREALWDAP